MKNQPLRENIDLIIDDLLKAKHVRLSDDFVAKTVIAASSPSTAPISNSAQDEIIDRFLGRLYPQIPGENFTDTTMSDIRRKSVIRHIQSIIAGLSVAACALFAVSASITSAPSTKNVLPALRDYAAMSEMSDEINAINVLLAQEEIFDALRL